MDMWYVQLSALCKYIPSASLNLKSSNSLTAKIVLILGLSCKHSIPFTLPLFSNPFIHLPQRRQFEWMLIFYYFYFKSTKNRIECLCKMFFLICLEIVMLKPSIWQRYSGDLNDVNLKNTNIWIKDFYWSGIQIKNHLDVLFLLLTAQVKSRQMYIRKQHTHTHPLHTCKIIANPWP